MASPEKQQPEEVADKVLKRAEVSKIARRLQNRLALAQFKTKHGWEDLTLDTIEPKYEEELRRKRLTADQDMCWSCAIPTTFCFVPSSLMALVEHLDISSEGHRHFPLSSALTRC
ncbi:hypothetical protein Cob_v008753 [Colletotrichum orbiculare MAFF 240422]|uniref:Uncharacterized protein n=1 Tax=Colletotrichum orbiculare (strain 104-T / ATCC 96160 / CBS 514.97 / LARS 414 / MAFF 240422) TaxID=1213857 RepID=A0A484FL23_COLOR|nr:hypothetical protein Cob_v008753 [Colletotrichum orbiculare MAFF 240422]